MVFNASIRYVASQLRIDELSVESIAAATGTPVYIYSGERVRANYRRLERAFAPLAARLHFSVKSNGSLAILRCLQAEGAGFDCVSAGEIALALSAGAAGGDIVFAGVGKTRQEIAYAIEQGIGSFNVENTLELSYINDAAAAAGVDSARVALRFNPQVSAKTHPHLATGHGGAKFGMTADVISRLLASQARYPRVKMTGIHMHIGSQLGDSAATLSALEKLLALIRPWQQISSVNLGGGFPVAYRFEECPPALDELAQAMSDRLDGYEVLLEPGRAIVADAGLLVAEVLYVKRQAGQLFYIIDASMSELIRPALYGAHHEIVPLRQREGEPVIAQVAGPVCESADLLGRDRALPLLAPGDKLALMTAGAYGMAMASNYNARPRPAEVMVEGDAWRVCREGETVEDLVAASAQPVSSIQGRASGDEDITQ